MVCKERLPIVLPFWLRWWPFQPCQHGVEFVSSPVLLDEPGSTEGDRGMGAPAPDGGAARADLGGMVGYLRRSGDKRFGEHVIGGCLGPACLDIKYFCTLNFPLSFFSLSLSLCDVVKKERV